MVTLTTPNTCSRITIVIIYKPWLVAKVLALLIQLIIMMIRIQSVGVKRLDYLILQKRLTCICGKTRPTTKLANQLTSTATLIAAGLGPCEKSSAVIIQGIDPRINEG